MTRTRPQLALALLAFIALAAAGCVGFNNPEGWAGPAVVDDVLLASTAKGELSALNSEDFSSVWSFPTGDEEPALELEAIYGTPVVAGGNVYFGAYDGNVYALSLETGKPLWKQPFPTDGPIVAGLAASESAVYAASEDGQVYALDPKTGEQAWDRPFDAGDSIWAAPLFVEGVLYVASVSGRLYALDAETGRPKWDKPFETGHGLVSDPALADGIVLAGGLDRTLHAVDAATGQERWSFPADNWFWGRPLVEDGVVYAPNLDGRVFALDLATGEEMWSFEAEDALRSAPVLAGDVLVVADRDGNVYGLDPESGDPAWGPKALLETVLANPELLGGQVLISAQGGELFRVDDAESGAVSRFDPDTGSFVEVVTP
jgi:outer membrane protein assembly factor BamB